MGKQFYSGWTFWSDDCHHLDWAKFNFSYPTVHAEPGAERCIFKWHTYHQENSRFMLAAQNMKKEGKKTQSKNASRLKLPDQSNFP